MKYRFSLLLVRWRCIWLDWSGDESAKSLSKSIN